MLRLSLLHALLLTATLSASGADAFARGRSADAVRATSGYGVPQWVMRECRPANGAEIMARFAGNGYYFYRDTGDYCYFDRRPGIL